MQSRSSGCHFPSRATSDIKSRLAVQDHCTNEAVVTLFVQSDEHGAARDWGRMPPAPSGKEELERSIASALHAIFRSGRILARPEGGCGLMLRWAEINPQSDAIHNSTEESRVHNRVMVPKPSAHRRYRKATSSCLCQDHL